VSCSNRYYIDAIKKALKERAEQNAKYDMELRRLKTALEKIVCGDSDSLPARIAKKALTRDTRR